MATVNVNITSSTPDPDPVTVSIGDTLQFTSKDSHYRVSALANVLGASRATLDVPPNGSKAASCRGTRRMAGTSTISPGPIQCLARGVTRRSSFGGDRASSRGGGVVIRSGLKLATLLLAALPAMAQFESLSTTHDGSVLFFTSRLSQAGTNQPHYGKVFLVDSRGVPLLVRERVSSRPDQSFRVLSRRTSTILSAFPLRATSARWRSPECANASGCPAGCA